MRRIGFALLGVAAALALALVLATTKGSSVTASPACLPSTIDHSARLAGTRADVSPAPETSTANPHTQISVLGRPAGDIREVTAVGQRSGPHKGRLESYSQGDGASFVPNAPFDAGEQVSVKLVFDNPPANGNVSATMVDYRFRVDTPYSTAGIPPFPNPPASPADYQGFATLPGIQAPTLTVTTPDRDPGAGDVFTTNGPSAGKYGPLIYTPQGRLVWFDQLKDGMSAENLSVQSYEGGRDLTFWQGKVLSLGFGEGEDVVLDSSYRTVARVRGGNGLRADLHDFQLAPGGVAYATAYNPIRCDLRSQGGERGGALLDTAVQEIDVRTGLVRWEWHSLDHVAVGESETSPPKGTPWDWFHLNSIDVQPGGDLLISARSTWASYLLRAGSGTIAWRLGGSRSSFAMGAGTRTAWQHDARLVPGGEVTLFDDGSNPPEHSQSRGVRIALNTRAHTATLRTAYVHRPPLLSASQGNMQTLPGGNVLVGWGSVPQISELSPAGKLLWDARLSYDMSSYRAFRFPWSAQPAYPPVAAANFNNTGEETIVRASWNGATDVAKWRVLATVRSSEGAPNGQRPGALNPVGTFADSDFESATILSKRYAYVAVQALDLGGRVLATSQPVRVGPYSSASTSR